MKGAAIISMRSHCLGVVAAALAWVVSVTPAFAGDCAIDMATADKLISGVRDREETLGRYAKDNDMPNACKLLRQNAHDMGIARDSMNRCMTGHDRGENVAQLDASIGDIHDVIAARCR
ncbi:MAG: hypothetical protein JO056_12805 [Alphaproteobacteria bacterium]|nr:hypothetical protein [Alphaproteobacteria bacterium]